MQAITTSSRVRRGPGAANNSSSATAASPSRSSQSRTCNDPTSRPTPRNAAVSSRDNVATGSAPGFIGATVHHPGDDLTVMHDPEGNEFCVG